MRPLMLGPDEHALIAALTAKAAADVVSHATMLRLKAAYNEGRVTPELRNMNNDKTIHLPFDYQVTLTHEEHKLGVVCRHLSVSVKAAGKCPNPYAVGMIMEAFGFKNALDKVPIWTEPIEDGRTAISVIEPLDGDINKILKEPKPT